MNRAARIMRTLRTQIMFCTRAQWVLGAGMALMLGLFFLFGYRQANNRLRDLRIDEDRKLNELSMGQARLQSLDTLELEVERLRLKLARFDKKLPRQQDLGAFMRDITLLSQQSSLRKWMVQPDPKPRRQDLFSELPIVLSFEGDFASVFAFLRQTEEMQRLTRVRSIRINSRDAKLGQVEVQMAMSIYFAEG